MIGNPLCPHCHAEAMRAASAESRATELKQQLADTQAALRASTELLQSVKIHVPGYWQPKYNNQIAANEAVLGGGK